MTVTAKAAPEAVAAVKQEILDALFVLLNEGMFEKAFGHISARIPGTDLICMMGHIHDTERTLFDITTDELIVIDADGNVVDGLLEPPGEFPIHTEVLRARPDVNCVVHCHPHWPVALSITRQDLIPVTYRAGIFFPRVPRFPDPRQIEQPEHGQAVAATLGSGRAVMLTGHGVVCVGENVQQAAVVTIDLADAARFQMEAMASGQAHALADEYIAYRQHTPADAEGFTAAWNYYSTKWLRGRK